ncbi:hypothetical protein GF386_06665 [Candidatus Pacearchaeota archaeon]|nr:hypothetical protein [Candidatus Pacearchaeota archaeon]MBD3283775.1 hypothetical protein [Candidatus Pacearchaeota archaeon]
MPKKAGSKKTKRVTKKQIEEALVENFINMQKVLTNLTVKFDELSGNISKLLQLFEISAKNFAEKYGEGYEDKSTKIDKEFLEKLDRLLDQNKTISKGIMLMEEKIKGKSKEDESKPKMEGFRPKPIPKYQWE